MKDATALLARAAKDENGIVRLEAAIAASYLGSADALEAILPVLDQPMGSHLNFAAQCALISEPLSRHWQGNDAYLAAHPSIGAFTKDWKKHGRITEGITTRSADDANFDSQKNLATIEIECIPDSPKILHATKLLNPETGEVLRFNAPKTSGEYPYLCTFPGHWIIMHGTMTVK